MTCDVTQTAQILSVLNDMKQGKAEIPALENLQQVNVWNLSLKNAHASDLLINDQSTAAFFVTFISCCM